MKKSDLFTAIIIGLLINSLLLYMFANIVSYAYVIPSSYSFTDLAISGRDSIDGRFGYSDNSGWGGFTGPNEKIPSLSDMPFFIFISPFFIYSILLIINIKTPKFVYQYKNTIKHTFTLTIIPLGVLIFYFFCDSSKKYTSPYPNIFQYPPIGYIMILMAIGILILNYLRLISNDEIIDTKFINLSISSILGSFLSLYLFFSYFYCTVTSTRVHSNIIDNYGGIANLFFSLNGATYAHYNPYNYEGLNECFYPAVILGFIPILLIICHLIKLKIIYIMPTIKTILSIVYIVLTILTMLWFKNHFLIYFATKKENPILFNYVSLNFYVTIGICLIICIISIFTIISQIIKDYKIKHPKKYPDPDGLDDELINCIKESLNNPIEVKK